MTQAKIRPATSPKAEPKPELQNGTFAVLRQSNFAWFLSGTTLSDSAQWIQQVTLSWLVYDLTSSGAMLGTLNLVRSIAMLGLGPIAGVAIDRFSHRKLLYATSTWLFAISFGFGLMLLSDPRVVWPLFLFSFLGGIGKRSAGRSARRSSFRLYPRPWPPVRLRWCRRDGP